MLIRNLLFTLLFAAQICAVPTAVFAFGFPGGGGGGGGGAGGGGGGGGGGGPGGAPLPLLGGTLLGNAALLGGGYIVWRRRNRKANPDA